MSNLRQAAQHALEVMDDHMYRADTHEFYEAKEALRAALAEPEQEPDGIGWLKRDSGYFTAPTPRKPLTDEELEPLLDAVPFYDIGNKDLINLARAIERAHGIGEQT